MIEQLEAIISILKRVDCTTSSPLPDKLAELEKLYGEYPVHTLCDALEISRGTFYNHIKRNKREDTSFNQRREELKKQIRKIYNESNYTYGASKITAILKDQAIPVSTEMVRILMREMGLQSVRYGSKKIYEKEQTAKQKTT